MDIKQSKPIDLNLCFLLESIMDHVLIYGYTEKVVQVSLAMLNPLDAIWKLKINGGMAMTTKLMYFSMTSINKEINFLIY